MTRIVTVTLNPAIDITYEVREAPRAGESIRITRVRERAGGKGVNVAAVARSLGARSLVLAPTVRSGADPFRSGLDALGLEHSLVPALDAVRRTIAVVPDAGPTTSLLEPGSPAPAGLDTRISARLRSVPDTGTVVISGSVPPGVDPALPGVLAAEAVARGVPAVVDVSGEALRLAARSGGVLMPNRDELAELTGVTPGDTGEVAECARKLVAEGAAAVVATLGPDGLVAVTPAGTWAVPAPVIPSGNPTGAGDAAAAALALHLASGPLDAAALVDVVATSAACVLRPVAGEIDMAARERFLRDITVEELA
jgi:tagatose 6-phosphate kinase